MAGDLHQGRERRDSRWNSSERANAGRVSFVVVAAAHWKNAVLMCINSTRAGERAAVQYRNAARQITKLRTPHAMISG